MNQRLITQADEGGFQDNPTPITNLLQNKFHILQIIGNGTFGMVYLALDIIRKNYIIKFKFHIHFYLKFISRKYLRQKIQKQRTPYKIRIKSSMHYQIKINILYLRRECQKCNLIIIIHFNLDDLYLNLVMDYISDTLYQIIRNYKKNKTAFPNILLKIYSYQMLRGLAYLEDQELEFFIAIFSRYYRAPELIFGVTEYTISIDVWSTGCVIVEMFTGEPLFLGQSATDQLIQIIKILGTHTIDQIKQMNPQHKEFKFPQIKCSPSGKVFSKFQPEPQFFDFVSKLLVYSPKMRLKPLETLLHPIFDEIRQQGFSMSNIQLPKFFDFQKRGITDST